MCMLAVLVQHKLSFWDTLGASEKNWTIFASASALALTASGWLYAVFGWRIVGFLHGVLMLGVAGLCLYVLWTSRIRPHADDPASGFVAAISLVLIFAAIVVGVFAAICGVSVMLVIFDRKGEIRKRQV